MTTTTPSGQPTTRHPRALPAGPIVPAIGGIAICLLLAIAQVALAGYQMGVGNQSIQIAFLKRLADPTLYPADAMVNQTMPLYPSFFFAALAPLLKFTNVASLYLFLQILTSFLTLSAVYWLSRGIYRTHIAALAAVALLVAGHMHALAGDTLYSEGFTHTFAALPIAILALAFAYRGRWVAAFAACGILFNIHALTAAYAFLMLAAAMLADFPDMPLKKWLTRAALCAFVGIALSAPTLAIMATAHQNFGGDWVDLMRIRSADHSFPSTWWAPGDPDLPRFTLLLALFVLSWSFTPVRRALQAAPTRGTGVSPVSNPDSNRGTGVPPVIPEDPDAPAGDPTLAMKSVRRASKISLLMTLAVLALFIAGYLFTEVFPIPTIIRLQPFRASRLLMILMLVHIAHGAIAAIRAGIGGRALATSGQWISLSLAARIAEVVAGIAILLTLALPWMLGFLPVALVLALIAAALAGHLSWRQSLVASAALLIALFAYLQIDFALPILSPDVNLLPAPAHIVGAAIQKIGWFALVDAAIFALAIGLVRHTLARRIIIATTLAVGSGMAGVLFTNMLSQSPASLDAKLTAWVQKNTSKNALFLAPTGFANFRIQADRSLVADWRDGTQLYFCGAFADTWIKRVEDIEPGLKLSEDGHRLITRGDESLDARSDQELLELAKKYQPAAGNCFIILKTTADHPRSLASVYSDPQFTIYSPRLLAAPTRPVPPGVINTTLWNDAENFMETTVPQNIEKYRKADVTLQVTDQNGQPLQGVAIKIDETKSAFTFGASLGVFEPATNQMDHADGDQLAPANRPIELEKLPEVFNGSMIPFSAKWSFIEPQKGVYHWSDLDKYVDYCTKNNLTMEFHHLTGLRPIWVAQEGGSGPMTGLDFPPIDMTTQQDFNRHCLAVLDRYGDKIKYYQVVNEKYMMQYVPAAWKLLKQKYPNIQFGLSDCINFWDPSAQGISVRGTISRLRGGENLESKGMDSVKWLTDQGIKPDFFSIHGHHPANLWADPREMYAIISKVAALSPGMRIHISEEYLQLNGAITGPIRSGTLTPALQAEYLVRYFTIAFSHPSVDMVNLWGGMAFSGWTNTGLIDNNGKPTPGFAALKKLLNETFQSHLTAQLGLDGSWSGRLFHGAYQLTLTLPDGKQLKVNTDVPQTTQTKIRLKVDREKGTVEVLPAEKI